MIKIRESKNNKEEYSAIVRVHNSIWPNKLTIDDYIQSEQTRDPNLYYRRLVALADNNIVGYAVCRDPWEFSNPGYYQISISVESTHRRQGLGTKLFQRLMKQLEGKKPDTFIAETYENFDGGIAFLQKLGFKQTIRLPRSLLYLEKFDISKWNDVLNFVEKQGIKIVTLREYQLLSEDWKRNTWKLHVECIKDVPSTVELTEMAFDQYVSTVLEKLDLNYWIVALDNKKPIGLSILWLDEAEPEKMYTSLTGVIRSRRRNKIATAMKALNIQKAKETPGITTIETENEENNPMYQLNLQLGFESQPAKLGFEKKIR